jgi:hypothetical protein
MGAGLKPAPTHEATRVAIGSTVAPNSEKPVRGLAASSNKLPQSADDLLRSKFKHEE